MTKFFSIVAAVLAFAPVAYVTIHQAAQIVS